MAAYQIVNHGNGFILTLAEKRFPVNDIMYISEHLGFHSGMDDLNFGLILIYTMSFLFPFLTRDCWIIN